MLRNTRTPLACARCYKRKKGCDRKYPSCSQCTKARVQCIGLDRGSQAELPRSLFTHLQTLVGQLEAKKQSQGNSSNQNDQDYVPPPVTTDTDKGPPAIPEPQRTALAYVLAATTARGSTPVLSMETNICPRVALPYHTVFFMGAELPYPLAFQSQRPINFPSASPSNSHSDAESTKLPGEVAEKLIAVFTDRFLPQYPLFLKEEVLDMFQRFKRNKASPDERFIILMMEAITTIASKSRDYRKSVGLAESLRRDAFSCIDFGLSCHRSTMSTIQKQLLLALYGFFSPSSTNLWQIVGDATRIALELGLHHDTPVQADVGEEPREFRKRLFWTLYSIDRSVAITSHRPYSVAGDEIHATVPQILDNLDTLDPSHVRFMDKLDFLRLQAEVCSVNIGMRPTPNPAMAYENWMTSIDQRISEIKAQGANSQQCGFLEWQSLLLLHMPCRRNPNPDDDSLLKAFEAAVSIASAYWDLVQLDHIEYPWHATHHCYEAGNLILYSLWHFRPLIRDNYTTKQIFEVVHQISSFFILIVKQWPAAQQCGHLFDGLRKGALSYFREDGFSELEPSIEAKQLKDLVFRENADLLYARDQSHSPNKPMLSSVMSDTGVQGVVVPLDFASDLEYFDFFSFPETPGLQELEEMLIDNVPQGMDFLGISDTTTSTPEAEPEAMASEVSTMPHHVDEEQMKMALLNLPVCSHCKRRRIKCDVELPACRNCTKLQRECYFWDTAVSQQISRKRIHALKKQVEALMKELDEPTQTPDPMATSLNLRTSPHPPDLQMPWMETHLSLTGVPACNIFCRPRSRARNSPNLVFFGSTSAFAHLATEAGRSLSLPNEINEIVPPARGPSDLIETIFSCVVPSLKCDFPQLVAEDLASLYYRSIEICYPIMGQALIRQTLDQVYDTESQASASASASASATARVQLNLVLAISLALMSSRDQRLRLSAEACFQRAISCGLAADEFVNPSNTSLQSLLLLCIYAWIFPSALDIWRLIGHASRTCLDIIEVHGSDKTDSATTGTLYRTLYALESQFSIAFGRPRHLPDRADVPASESSSDLTSTSDMSTLVYDLARLQNRFHKDMMGRDYDILNNLESTLIDPVLPDLAWAASCVYEIKMWRQKWDAQVEFHCTALHTFEQEPQLIRLLKCWGQFQKCHSLIIAKTATDRRGQALISSADELALCREMLEAAHELFDRQEWSSGGLGASYATQFIIPLAWTHLHAIFKAVVVVLQQQHNVETQRLHEMGVKILESAGKSDDEGTAGLVTCLQGMYNYILTSGTT